MTRLCFGGLCLWILVSRAWPQQPQPIDSSTPPRSASVMVSNSPPIEQPSLTTSPPDAAPDDLMSAPLTADKPKSIPRKILDGVTPRCLDALFHTCWSQPPGEMPQAIVEREFARNMEIAKMYYHDRNYVGAQSRLLEALSYVPTAHEAVFMLARSLDKLRRTDEAGAAYREYLRLQPAGPHARDATSALNHLVKNSKGR